MGSSPRTRARQKSIKIQQIAKKRIAEQERATNSDYWKLQQNSDIRNYYHSVEIASARVDAILAKLDAPSKVAENELTQKIDSWQSELQLDDHPEYKSVSFNDSRNAVNLAEIGREIGRLQDDIVSDVKMEQVKAVNYWGLRKADRHEWEMQNLYGFDQESFKLGEMLEKGQDAIDRAEYMHERSVFGLMGNKFKGSIEARRQEWVDSLREKVEAVHEAKEAEIKARLEKTQALEAECEAYREKVVALDNQIVTLDIAENMESESYIALTKKHEHKQKHLMEIIDRQQGRIDQQSSKVIVLEDQLEEIQGYLQEIEASLHMSSDNASIIEKTLDEVEGARGRLQKGAGGTGNKTSFNVARATSMFKKGGRASTKRMTMLDADNVEKELKSENRRLTETLAETTKKLNIDGARMKALKELIMSLHDIAENEAGMDAKIEDMQLNIDDMDSVLYRLNNMSTVGGAKMLNNSFNDDFDVKYNQQINNLERQHGKIVNVVESYKEDIKRIWDGVGRAESDVIMWARSQDIKSKFLEGLASIRFTLDEVSKVINLRGGGEGGKSEGVPKVDVITDVFKELKILEYRDLVIWKNVIILELLKLGGAVGVKVDNSLKVILHERIKDGTELNATMKDQVVCILRTMKIIISAPKTFHLKNVQSSLEVFQNKLLGLKSLKALKTARSVVEVIRKARPLGLNKNFAEHMVANLVESLIMNFGGYKVEVECYRAIYVCVIIIALEKLKIQGFGFTSFEIECVKYLKSNFKADLSCESVKKGNEAIALLILKEGKVKRTPPKVKEVGGGG
ncbi:hypothetical protein TrLO_g1992, partial [Triparma laevis f. longispina]